jgi:Holliday junction resolvasome RuvABC DNA-binding subunit
VGTSSARSDVRDALGGLGYTDGEVREVMADLPDDGDAAALLRDALQRLGSARR